jgi:hypothetical protein
MTIMMVVSAIPVGGLSLDATIRHSITSLYVHIDDVVGFNARNSHEKGNL